MTTDEKKLPGSFEAYENGKHRRYSLLFAVNGGGFAVAKLIADSAIGGLTLSRLSFGMVLFTIAMVADIFMFGEKMRKTYLPNDAFGWQGKTVLLWIGVLLCGGWLLIACRSI